MPSLFAASETAHDGGKRLHTRIGYNEVGEPEALASPQQILDDLIARADKDGWHVQNVLGSNATPPSLTRELFGSLPSLLSEDRRHDHIQFQFVKAFSRGLTDPLDFLCDCGGQALRDLLGNGPVRQRFGKDANDRGFPRSKSQHALASGPDEEWRVRSLHGPGKTIEVRDRIVGACVGQWLADKESLEDVDGLFQAAYAYTRAFECHTGLFVLAAEPSRANPKLESPLG